MLKLYMSDIFSGTRTILKEIGIPTGNLGIVERWI